MIPMATWEDGPEYAPVARPEEFTAPDAAPLSVGESRSLVATEPPPAQRPELQAPQQAVAPLDTLTADRGDDVRDPSEAFTVVASLVTDKTSAWSAAHSTVISSPVDASWAPPGGTPGSQPIRLSGQPAQDLAGPAPSANGVPQSPHGQAHFGPGPGRPGTGFTPIQPPAPVSFGGFVMNLTPAVALTLILGGLIMVLSPLFFAAAFVLASRVRLARVWVLRTFTAGAILIGLVAFGAILGSPSLGQWWNGVSATSLICCWLALLVSAYMVLRAMQNGETPTPPGQRRQTW